MNFWSRSLTFFGWSGRRFGLPVGPSSGPLVSFSLPLPFGAGLPAFAGLAFFGACRQFDWKAYLPRRETLTPPEGPEGALRFPSAFPDGRPMPVKVLMVCITRDVDNVDLDEL